MLRWALIFLVIALIAALLGFGGVAGAAAGIAKILFFVFLILLVVSIIANGLLYFVIGRWLKPVERIVAAMDGIEQGDYRARLPAFELPEHRANVAYIDSMLVPGATPKKPASGLTA